MICEIQKKNSFLIFCSKASISNQLNYFSFIFLEMHQFMYFFKYCNKKSNAWADVKLLLCNVTIESDILFIVGKKYLIDPENLE